jgi:hypothetical protein
MNGANSGHAMKAGLGAFLGFLLGVGLKLAASVYMTYHFIKALL